MADSSSHTCARGAKLAKLLARYNIEPLNDGSITYLKNPKTVSCIDVTFASSQVAPMFGWCTDFESRGIFRDSLPDPNLCPSFSCPEK